ncbi:MAG: CFI-box-CTERM domain-containing protein, partial [Thermodesulfobacteriota bacterium]
FIATASFGTPLAPQVRLLSEFRDEYLLTNGPGRWFVRMYYTYSPPLADYIRERETLKAVIRVGLLPLIGFGDFMVNTTPAQKRLFVGALFSLLTVAGSLLLYRRRHASALYPLRTER